jgi:hypothetical protein
MGFHWPCKLRVVNLISKIFRISASLAELHGLGTRCSNPRALIRLPLLLIAHPGCVLVPRTPFSVLLVMMKPPGEQAALLVAVTVKLLAFHVVLHQKVQNTELNLTTVTATPKRRSHA